MTVAEEEGATTPLDDERPLTLATAFLGQYPDGIHLRHWREDFYAFERFVYRKVVMEYLVSDITTYLNQQKVRAGRGGRRVEPLLVTGHIVTETLKQMRAICQVRVDAMPAWIGKAGRPDADYMVAFENGLLDTNAMTLIPPTADWFSEHTLPCRFDRDVKCPLWQKFLNDSLENDGELIGLLQEWFGYCLTSDTSQQKMLWLIGPPGAGKGTITKMLMHVVGERNCASFSLFDLSEQFGLSPFLGKSVAISQDAHLDDSPNSIRVLEHIKAITGEDNRAVNRKNRDILENIRLKIRFVLALNQLPGLNDVGDTLRRRLLLIPFERSFAGMEDQGLIGKLYAETAGVAMWALAGLQRLRGRGRFSGTAKGRELQEQFTELTNPLSLFVRQCCEIHIGEEEGKPQVEKELLYDAYKKWARGKGIKKPLTYVWFCRNLKGTVPSIKPARPRNEGERSHAFEGISLQPKWQPDDPSLYTGN